MKQSRCKVENCGRAIVWAETAEGKRIPLDLAPPIYLVWEDDDGENICRRADGSPTDGRRGMRLAVSHFATRKDANTFSRRNG